MNFNFGQFQQPPNSNNQQNPLQNQKNYEDYFKKLSSIINNQIKSLDVKNPQGLNKQSLKNALGLNLSLIHI